MTYAIASTVEQALAYKADLGPEACWLAGGTALQLTWSDDVAPNAIIDISRMDCGPAVALSGQTLRLAATATLEAVRRASLVAGRFPLLSDAVGQIAAIGVRHAATIGGNLNWMSGDLIPLFLALDAHFIGADGRAIPLVARLTQPPADFLATAVEMTLPDGPVIFEKIGRRAAFSPSLVTVAAAATERGIRCAIGGGPVPPQAITLGGVSEVKALADLFTAPDDVFATGAHRKEIAARVLAGHLAAWNKAA